VVEVTNLGEKLEFAAHLDKMLPSKTNQADAQSALFIEVMSPVWRVVP
jgi:hypothetical protein